MKIEVFSPKFEDRLTADGFNVPEIKAEAAGGTIQHAYTTVHQWLDRHYPHRFLRDNLYHQQRDGVAPRIASAIDDVLAPWKKTVCTEFLPVITMKELSRTVGMHPRDIFHALKKGNPTFNIGEQELAVSMSNPGSFTPDRCNRKRWQKLWSKQDAEFFDIKLSLVAGKEIVLTI